MHDQIHRLGAFVGCEDRGYVDEAVRQDPGQKAPALVKNERKDKVCPIPKVTEETMTAAFTLPSFSMALNRKPRKISSSANPTKAMDTTA